PRAPRNDRRRRAWSIVRIDEHGGAVHRIDDEQSRDPECEAGFGGRVRRAAPERDAGEELDRLAVADGWAAADRNEGEGDDGEGEGRGDSLRDAASRLDHRRTVRLGPANATDPSPC